MFNHDIKRAFKRMDAKPTQQFKDHLKARIIPSAAPRSAFHPFRTFTLAGATLVLVFGVFTFFSPANINRALASAIQNTFAFSADGYHHLATQETRRFGTVEVTNTAEQWTDGTHAIFDYDARDIGGSAGSRFFDQSKNLECIYDVHEGEPSCHEPEFLSSKMMNAHSAETEDMPIKEISIERATDTHGDSYLTWITDRPLGTTLVNIAYGPYGYENSTFNGMYSWKNEVGDMVNRVTLFSEDILQPYISDTPETSFLVQLKETAPDDVGYFGSYNGTPISQSRVYLVDMKTMTVTSVSDEWLEYSRDVFNEKLLASTVSTETIQREYEQSFMYAIDIGARLDSYERISTEKGIEDGKSVEYVAYNLGTENPIIINTTSAVRVDFTREIDTNLIRDMKLYSDDGTLIYRAQLLAFEELPSAPEGLFTKEVWEARVRLME